MANQMDALLRRLEGDRLVSGAEFRRLNELASTAIAVMAHLACYEMQRCKLEEPDASDVLVGIRDVLVRQHPREYAAMVGRMDREREEWRAEV